MQEVKANYQVIVPVGPFVDVGDGFTPETGVVLGAADEHSIIKHNTLATVSISGSTWTAISGMDGYYGLTLISTNVDTEGMLTIVVQDDSVCLPVKKELMVLSQAAYDSKYTAKDSGYMHVNINTVEEADPTDSFRSSCTAALVAYDPPTHAEMSGALAVIASGNLAILEDTTEVSGLIAGLNNISQANVQSGAYAALTSYDPPTHTEMSGAFGALNDISEENVTSGCALAISSYDPPTHAEMSGAFGALNDVSTSDIETACGTALATYDGPTHAELSGAMGALNDLAATDITTACTSSLVAYDGPTHSELSGAMGALNDLSAANITTACNSSFVAYDGPTHTEMSAMTAILAKETNLSVVSTAVTAIKAKTDNLPSGIAKNVALNNFTFLMVLASDHVTAATGKTVTATISKDGGAFASATNSVTEIANGVYKINLTQTEMNADIIVLKFTETDCDQRTITIVTS